jgi:hypothetical protein
MATDNEIISKLRELMISPSIALPEYSADPIIQRRVGRMLAEAARYVRALCSESKVEPKLGCGSADG